MTVNNLSTICPLPFNSISYSMAGRMGPCTNCSLTNYKPIEDYWNSPELKQLRSDMINGIRNSACNECHRREDIGAWNTRQAMLPLIDSINLENPEIKELSFRFSNVCNYMCVDCSWTTSSLIYQEEINRGRVEAQKNNKDKPFIINASGDPHSLLEQGKLHVHKVDKVIFSGGEPLTHWQQWELLKYMVDNNIFPHLKYYTNLSRLTFKDYSAIEFWKQFKSIFIEIGFDAMDKKCEYFRKNMDFNKTIENIREVKRHIPNSEIFIVITFTWLNAISAADLFEYFLKNHPDIKITLNQVLHSQLDMQIAPPFKKVQINDALDRMYKISEEYEYSRNDMIPGVKDMILGLKKYLWAEDRSENFPEAIKWLRDLDEWRNQSFIEVFPEHLDLSEY